MESFEEFIVRQGPEKAYYIPNFLNEDEESLLLQKIYDVPKPKWTYLSNRRLQNWGGLPHAKGMVPEVFPEWLTSLMRKVDELNVFEGNLVNHVLVNEYLPGQGIMPHEDGPLFYPTITTITLDGHTLLDLYEPLSKTEEQTELDCKSSFRSSTSFASRKIGSLLLEPRSLLILKQDLYLSYLHGIAERRTDVLNVDIFNIGQTSFNVGDILQRTNRVSLTIRYFPKILKLKIKLR